MDELLLMLLFPLVIIVVTLILITKSSNSSSKSSSSPSPLPPGPRQLPIIGHLHHLLTAGEPLPHICLRKLSSQHGPLMLLRLGQVNLAVISSREAAEEILRTHDLCFASRPQITRTRPMTYGYNDIAMAPYGPDWRLLRKICITELLTAKRVASFASVRKEAALALVETIASAAGRKEAVNLRQKLQETTNDIISKAAFSREFRQGRKEEFFRIMKDMILLTSGFNLADFFPWLGFVDTVLGVKGRIERYIRGMDAILEEIISEHEERLRLKKREGIESGDDDLLDVLLLARDGEGLFDRPISAENVKAVAVELFFAGTDTSSTAMQWAMSELMRNPKAMEKVQREVRHVAAMGKGRIEEEDLNKLNYLKQVIKETLRLHPSLPLLVPRLCRETCQVQGYTVPAGTRVVVNVWALGRDSRYWEQPEKFLPERFEENLVDFKGANYEFLPFGAGRRICPGMNFGLASVEIVLANLLLYFDWELPNGMKAEDLDMTEVSGSTQGRKVDLCLLATPHVIPDEVA